MFLIKEVTKLPPLTQEKLEKTSEMKVICGKIYVRNLGRFMIIIWYANDELSNNSNRRHQYRKWTSEENKLTVHCYFMNNPHKKAIEKEW